MVVRAATTLVDAETKPPDVTKELPDRFSALKAVLEAISATYADDKVHPLPLVENLP